MARTQGAYSTAARGPALQRVWQVMRVLKTFTRKQVIATAEAGETAVQKYIRALADAGYLQLQAARVNGSPGSHDVWRLVRDSGPVAPIRRKDGNGVFDPNTQSVWNRSGQAVCTDRNDPDAVAKALLAKYRDQQREGECA